LKSFIQYIQEIVTDKPKSEPDYEHRQTEFGKSRHTAKPYTLHDYKYEHPSDDTKDGVNVNIATYHADAQKNHHPNFSSNFSFGVGGEHGRTGKQNPKDASKMLRHAVHAGSHHIRKYKPKFFSFEVAKHENISDKGNPKNPKARHSIYHKIMNRVAKKHGYEHLTTSDNDAGEQEVSYRRIDDDT
jgi:hypothetical protein